MIQTADQIRAASLVRALGGLGDWWSALIVREAFTGTRRFADFQAHLGIARQTLSLRLREMIDNGILYAKPYQDGPLRHEYRLTIKGLDLYGYALMCWKWNRRWGDQAVSRLPPRLVHRTCGHAFEPLFACGACGQEAMLSALRMADGPGLRIPTQRPRARSKRLTVSRDVIVEDSLYRHGAFVMADRWSHAILAWVFLGHSTFEAFEVGLGIAPGTLANRLRHLVEARLLRRAPDPDDRRRAHYRLTPRGLDLFPISLMLFQWAERWAPSPNGATTLIFHDFCGNLLDPVAQCDACRKPLDWRDVDYGWTESATASG